jgi:hypothetical protein
MKNLFIVLLFTSLYCVGQLPDYYVFLVKGDVTVTKPGIKPVPVKQNSFIYKADIINLKNGAEITLADKDQNFFVLRSPGIYEAKNVAKTKPDHIPGITQTYLKLVWNELLNPNHDFTKFTNDNIAGVYGGVSRGDLCNNLIFPVKGLRTSADSLHFKWHQTSPASNYALIIYNSEGKEIVNMPVKDTQKTLHIIQALHSVTGDYYWLVKGENAACEDEEPVYFELMTHENEQKLISSLLPGNRYEDLAGQLQAINKLEKNAMIPAASAYYSTLVNDNPGNEALLKSYIAFLLKYSFDEKAYNMWQKIPVKK